MQNQTSTAKFVEFKDSMTEAQLREMARTGEMPLPSVVVANAPRSPEAAEEN
jgi:hypothetical protein